MPPAAQHESSPTDDKASTERFSSRVANYARYRPRYPRAVVEHLAAEGGLGADAVVADVGSGTGFLGEPFLRHGCTVYGIEPNAAMRAAAEQLLAGDPRFHSVAGTAEATGLPDASVDWALAGQAFHWFDPEASRAEFRRILRPGGHAAICWNLRDAEGSPFMAAYAALIRRFSPEYDEVGHDRIGTVAYDAFFGAGRYRLATFPNAQSFDLEGLRGRLLSSSYTPAPGHPDHAPMLAALEALFAEHASDGRVAFPYRVEVYWGRPG